MAQWESIGHNYHMCPKYSQWVARDPGEHPCTFVEMFAAEVQDNQDGSHTEIRTLRCPLSIVVFDQIDPWASKEASANLGRPTEIRASLVLGVAEDQLHPEMGYDCSWGQRGERPNLGYPTGY